METRCFHKKLEFQRYPPKDFCTARYEHKPSEKKASNVSKTPKKITPGPIMGQDRPEKNSARCLFEAARFRVLDRHRSTKPTTAPRNLNGARPLGAPTHPLVRVHKTTGDRWRAPARRLIQHTSRRCCVENRRQDFSIPLRWQKIGLFSGLGEERWTPRATSRPLDHGST